MTMLDDRDRLLLDTLRALAKANEEIGRLREALSWLENLDPPLVEAAREKFLDAHAPGQRSSR